MSAATENRVAMSLLDPLSQATETTLQALHLGSFDYLVIDVDEEVRRFVVKGISAKVVSEDEPERCQFCSRTKEQHEGLGNGYHTFESRTLRFKNPNDTRKFSSMSGGPTYPARYQWIERVPERKQEREGSDVWVLAGTDFTALIIQHAWPEDRLIFANDRAELLYRFLLKRFYSQNKNAVAIAKFKQDRTVPELPADFITHPEYPPLPFQRLGVYLSANQEASALFMDPGTGKTATTINRINYEAQRKAAGKIPGLAGMYRALIICPNQVRLNWSNEFSKFSVVPGKVGILRGGPFKRIKRLRDTIRPESDCVWSATVIGFDSVESMIETLRQIPWDLVVVDESHYIKNSYTARWKSIIQLRENSRQRQILTGTPIANTVMDLWAQLEFLGDGMSGFLTYNNYKKFHGVLFKDKSSGGTAIEKLVGIKNIPILQERLARISFMITMKEAGIELPDKTYDIVEVQMTKKQAEYYTSIAEQLALEIEDMMKESDFVERDDDDLAWDDDSDKPNDEEEKLVSKTLTANHVLTKLLRLAQITSGHVKWDEQRGPDGSVIAEGRVEQIGGCNPKIDAVMEKLLSEDRDPNCKTIIWCCFREDIRELARRLEDEMIGYVLYYGGIPQKQREAAERAFNTDPNVKVMIANPTCGGAGLNLLGYDPLEEEKSETYCGEEYFFSQDWSALKRAQAEARAHRKGTRRGVQITDFVVPGTIDEEIRTRVTRKQKTALEIQDVREILKNVLSYSYDAD